MPSSSFRFLIPSLLGVLIFLTPIAWNGQLTIGIGVLTGWVRAAMGDYGLHFIVLLTVVTSAMTLVGTCTKPAWISRRKQFDEMFDVTPAWVLIRLVGTAFALIYFFQFGPQILQSDAIGRAVLVDIGVNVVAVYISACLLLPLLTDYGLMEFAGTLARPVFRRLFQLPGRAAIDAVASFVGASAVGLLITIGQHDRGNYSGREASVIATNFSIVSIPFSLVIAAVAGIEHLFLPWYGIVVLACLIAAFITPRLPPLSGKSDSYKRNGLNQSAEVESRESSLLEESWRSALQRAGKAPGPRGFLAAGLKNLAFFLFSVVTPAMALATIALLLVRETPVFVWLGTPFVGVLEIAGLPEAAAAATALFSGFADQFMPALAAADVASETTSFVLAGLSVCQLIFMSESGVIILRSSLPLGLADLALIFLLRTAIVLPVLIVGAHLIT